MNMVGLYLQDQIVRALVLTLGGRKDWARTRQTDREPIPARRSWTRPSAAASA